MSDDLPVALFTTREAADKFVATIDDEPIDKITSLLHLDVTSPICATIVEFDNGLPPGDGAYVPVRADIARDFTAEEESAEP